ncbi:MAG: DNA polymerase III subunit gamma/tau [bacterium]|nr:DNA polymerase III subunit gamma/tau [bacterium]
MEQALYLKWRPTTFDDMVGQEHITRTLRNALKSGRIRHAYLFSGPRGTGKTTSARLLAKAVNCQHPDPEQRPCNQCEHCIAVNEGRFLDLIEIDAATHTGVDDVRDLRDKIAFAPGQGRFKVYIIDEVHRFSGSAFDALLKTLEEPPDHAIFVLATTEIDKVPPTIKSRSLQFEFRRLSVREVADRLELICQSDGLSYERAALEMVARQGTGSVRDSISLLDQIVTDPTDKITVGLVQQALGTAASTAVRALINAIVSGDSAGGLRVLHDAIDAGTDPKHFGQQVIDHLRALLLANTGGAELIEASDDDRALFTAQAAQINRNALVRAVKAFNEAINTKVGWQPQLSLELALIESVHGVNETSEPAASESTAPPSYQRPGAQTAPPAAVLEPTPPDEPPSPPGTPPLVEAGAITARWNDVLTAMHRINATSPAVMQEFRVHHVEGNTVYLSTGNQIFFDRIYPFPEKRKVVEKALFAVFNQRLHIQVLLIDNAGVVSGQPETADPLMSEINAAGGRSRRTSKKSEKSE